MGYRAESPGNPSLRCIYNRLDWQPDVTPETRISFDTAGILLDTVSSPKILP